MKTWKNWFAWYPVAFGPHIKWLVTIQRYYNAEEKAWYYRRVPWAECAVPRVRKEQDIDWVARVKILLARPSK